MSARLRAGRCASLLAAALLLLLLGSAAATSAGTTSAGAARAKTYTPPPGKIWAGLSGGTSTSLWANLTHHHPPVFEVFMTWNTKTAWLSARDPDFRSRIALHMSTAPGYGEKGVISPEGIARGRSDKFLVGMNRNLALSKRIFYIRIMGEPNGYWNPYCPFNSNGSSRGRRFSTYNYRQAWRRTVLILRGGSLQAIDSRLHALKMAPVKTKLKRSASLPRPKLTFIWAPQTSGDPDIGANEPGNFWPGGAYVDWVGTDFYQGDNFTDLDDYYAKFDRGKPFDLSEWGVVTDDQGPAFVTDVFNWVRSHSHVRMFNYYQGFGPNSKEALSQFPNSAAVLRRELHSTRFPQYPPEYRHPPKHHKHHKHHKAPPPPHPKHHGTPPTPPQLCVTLPIIGKICIPSV